MNDLFSGSFSRFRSEEGSSLPSRYHNNVEMTANSHSTGGVNLDRLFEDVEAINDELRALETLHNQLQSSHEHSKTLHNAKSVKDLRSKMDNDVADKNLDESTIDTLISTGQSETFLQKVIQEQGRGQVMDTILEINERRDAVKERERERREKRDINLISFFFFLFLLSFF